jgi:methionyl-tRNA formyltransferase
VKEFAESRDLSILQPENLKDTRFLNELQELKADIFLVVAFRMLPEEVWKMPSIGTINLHASLLPHYRGAAPINHVLINGESTTGVTTFLIDDKIDTGNILMRKEVRILPGENAGELHDRLKNFGARLVIKTLEVIAEKGIHPVPQENFIKKGEKLKTAPKIFLKDCQINWHKDNLEVHNLIRGLSPNPCARSFLVKEPVSVLFKVFESQPENKDHSHKPGEIVSDGKNYFKIACKSGFINIVNLQIEGKRRMNAVEFLRGFNISEYKIGTGNIS